MSSRFDKVIFGSRTEESFFHEIWGKQVLYSPASFDAGACFSIEELTEYLRETGLTKYGTTSAGKERRAEFNVFDQPFDVSRFKSLRELYVLDNFYDVKACFDDGRGILAHRLERFLSPGHHLRQIYNFLLEATGCIREEIILAAFLTPPRSKTFDWHVDSDHVFTMQIEGTKVWEIEEPGGEIRVFELSPGDQLYVPADLPHRVVATDRTSLSISFVVVAKTYAQIYTSALLRRVDAALSAAGNVRTPLPLYWMTQDRLEVDRSVAEIFRSFGVSEDDFHESLRDERKTDAFSLFDKNWKPNFRYRKIQEIVPDTWLAKSSETPIEYSLSADGTKASILMSGRPRIDASANLAEAISFIDAHEGSFQCSWLPDSYSAESKVLICTKLLRAGVLDFP